MCHAFYFPIHVLLFSTAKATKERNGSPSNKIAKDVIADRTGQFMTTGSPLSSSPNLFSNVTSTMPPLFPRPSTTNQLSKLDVLPTCSATEALMMPSFPPSIYSPSLPLFGHRYFSAINHAAAASLFPHQSSSNPFLRNGAGTIAQQLENDASTSSSIRSDALGKAFLQSREDFPSSRHTIDELSSRVLSQVRKWFYYFIS